MKNKIKYVHTNLIARDWKKLAQFYIDVFDCEPTFPERDLSGEWIERMTGIGDVKIRGIHLRLPGYKNGPTLEIFQYDPLSVEESSKAINITGYRHIAFHVSDVGEILSKLIAHGGNKYGEVVRKEIAGIGTINAVYATDPEGNIIEIQNWD